MNRSKDAARAPAVAGAPRREGRRRLVVLVLLLGVALAFWAQAPLRRSRLERQPLPDLAAYAAAHPSDTDAALLLAERALKAGDPAQAESAMLRLIQAEPGNARAWLLRSQAEFAQGKLAAAYASLQVAMPFLSHSAEAHWRMGLLLERQDQEAEAEAAFRRALERDPEHVGANLELARIALAERHYGPALQHLRGVIRREPHHVAALEAMSLAYRGLGNLEQAERYAREETRLAPQSAGAWRALGQVLKDRATPAALSEAEQAFRRALQLAPGSAELYEQLGMISFSRGDYRQAAAELQRAIDLQPLSRQAYPTLIQCYRRLGQTGRAEKLTAEYRKIDEMDLATAPLEYSVWAMPGNTAIRIRLAKLYLHYRRPDLARTQIERVLELNPSHTEARRLRQQVQSKVR